MVIFLVDLPIWRWWFSIVFWDCLLVMGIPKNLVLGMSWQDLEMGTTPLATEASSSVLGGAALLGRLRAPWEIPRWWDVRWYGKRVMLSDFDGFWSAMITRACKETMKVIYRIYRRFFKSGLFRIKAFDGYHRFSHRNSTWLMTCGLPNCCVVGCPLV